MIIRDFNLFSPTRGERYTVEEVLNKLLVRRNFNCTITVVPYAPVYGSDHDGHVHLEATTVASVWTDSVNCKLLADIPYHRTCMGKYTFGMWKSCPEGNEEPEYRKNPMVVSVKASLGDDNIVTVREDVISFDWEEAPYTEDKSKIAKIQNLIEEFLREAIVQLAFRQKFFEEAL